MIFGCKHLYRCAGKIQKLIFTKGIGAAYGTAKSGIGIAGVGTYRPDLIMKVE
jgi:hypothetical protein